MASPQASPRSYREEGSASVATGKNSPFAAWFNDKAIPSSRSPLRANAGHDAHEQSRTRVRKRVVQAVSSVLGPAANLAHEALFVGVDLLQFAPVPALDVAGQALLGIWDAVEMIEINRLSSLRLTERCAELLLAIREEIDPANADVADELREPVAQLHAAFEEIGDCLQQQARRPFWLRYVKREEVQRNISYYDKWLDNALGLFNTRIQIRTYKLVQANGARCQPGEGTSGRQPLPGDSPTTDALPTPPDVDETQDVAQIRRSLSIYRESQNLSDRARDLADLRQLLHATLQTTDDDTMMEVLQVGRHEMPEAIKLLQVALNQEMEHGQAPLTRRLRPGTLPDAPGQEPAVGKTRSLDQEFIRTSIRALKHISRTADLGVSSSNTTGDGANGNGEVQVSSILSSTTTALDEHDANAQLWPMKKESVDVMECFKASFDDPSWKLLHTAVRSQMMHYGSWQNYVVFICSGPLNDRIERCLPYDEKPLLLFQKLSDATLDPFLMLRHINDIPSPIVIAQRKQAAAAAPPLNTASSSVAGWPELVSLAGDDSRSGLHSQISKENLGYSVAIYPHMAEQKDELDFVVDDMFTIISRGRGRWIVQRDIYGTGTVHSDPSKQGWAPAGCLLETSIPIAQAIASTPTPSSSNSSTTPSLPATTDDVAGVPAPILPLYIVSTSTLEFALMDYKKKHAQELDLSKHDALRIFRRYQYWSYAVKENSGERGWVPSWCLGKAKASVQMPLIPEVENKKPAGISGNVLCVMEDGDRAGQGEEGEDPVGGGNCCYSVAIYPHMALKSMRQVPVSSGDPKNSDDPKSSDNLKSFKVSLEDPAWKVLPEALRKYKIYDDDWQNYAMFICYGPPNNRIERCLSYDEKPLLLFQKLKDASKNPVFMLKHIKDIPSPIAAAQQKQAARKASNSTSPPVSRGGAQDHGRTLSRPPELQLHVAQAAMERPLNTGSSAATGWPELMSSAGGDSRPRLHTPASNSNLSMNETAPKSAVAPLTASSAGGDGLVHESGGGNGKENEQPVGGENLGYSVAIYPYMAEQEDGFDVVVGDTFVIISRARGWWVVQRDPQGTGTVDSDPSIQGWVPAGCLLETRIPIARAIASTSTPHNPNSNPGSPTNGVAGGINARTPILPLHIVSTSFPGYALMDYKK